MEPRPEMPSPFPLGSESRAIVFSVQGVPYRNKVSLLPEPFFPEGSGGLLIRSASGTCLGVGSTKRGVMYQ